MRKWRFAIGCMMLMAIGSNAAAKDTSGDVERLETWESYLSYKEALRKQPSKTAQLPELVLTEGRWRLVASSGTRGLFSSIAPRFSFSTIVSWSHLRLPPNDGLLRKEFHTGWGIPKPSFQLEVRITKEEPVLWLRGVVPPFRVGDAIYRPEEDAYEGIVRLDGREVARASGDELSMLNEIRYGRFNGTDAEEPPAETGEEVRKFLQSIRRSKVLTVTYKTAGGEPRVGFQLVVPIKKSFDALGKLIDIFLFYDEQIQSGYKFGPIE